MSTPTTIELQANGALDHAAVIANLKSHTVAGLQDFNPETKQLSRWIEVSGTQQFVQAQLIDAHLRLTTYSQDPLINDAIARRVKHWLDLDTDLAPINAHLAQDPLFATQVSQRPGIRITRHHAPFEGTILAVLGQQVTLSTGRLFAARLVEAFGAAPSVETAEAKPPRSLAASRLRMFPAAQKLAATPVDELRAAVKLTNSRARTVSEVAKFFAERGPHSEHVELPPLEELATVYGIGPWTLDVLAIRAACEKDAFPASDAVLRRILTAAEPGFGLEKNHDAVRVASWSPYRSYAAQRLWARLNDQASG